MATHADKLGFTLLETIVATTISTAVLSATASTIIFCQRLLNQTMAEAESALVMREVRDKLLFRAGPGLNSGLLTGKASADSASITMNWEDTSEGPNCIRLVWGNVNNENSQGADDSSSAGFFFNERIAHTPANLKWFKPGNFLVPQTWEHTVDLPRIRIDLVSPVNTSVRQTVWILLPQVGDAP